MDGIIAVKKLSIYGYMWVCDWRDIDGMMWLICLHKSMIWCDIMYSVDYGDNRVFKSYDKDENDNVIKLCDSLHAC